MKKLLFLSAFLLMNYLSAQPFLPMFEPDHVWNVDIYYSPYDPTAPPQYWTVTQEITIGGTIIFNGKEYYILYNNDQEITCYMREENGLVYKYSEEINDEVIYFDFTLEVGDIFGLGSIGTLPEGYCNYHGFNNTGNEMEVIEVYTDFIAGANRKVIRFDHTNGSFPVENGRERWVEGIGSLLGGIDPVGFTIDIADRTALVCFTENSSTTFFNDASSCDNTTLGLPDEDKKQIILYPNPVVQTSILQIPESFSVNRIEVYSISGKLITEEAVAKNYYLFDAMQYRSGLYFYKLYSETEVIKTNKFIVK